MTRSPQIQGSAKARVSTPSSKATGNDSTAFSFQEQVHRALTLFLALTCCYLLVERRSLQSIADAKAQATHKVAADTELEWISSLNGCGSSSAAVEAMYDGLPYPPRDVEAEKRRPRKSVSYPRRMNTPATIAHMLYEGEHLSWGKQRPYRILVAGGGAGDPTIMLARTFANAAISTEIVHLELAKGALEIARKRVATYGKDFEKGGVRVSFVQASITSENDFPAGPFDFVDCTGVLHHLDDPALGLQALASRLAPGGGMKVMLYAPLGRTGVQPFQRMHRLLQGDVKLARAMLNQLPKSNWLRRNEAMYTSRDLTEWGDSGLSDMLLNPCESAYDVPSLVQFFSQANLSITEFWKQGIYSPTLGVPQDVYHHVKGLSDWLKQAAFMEFWRGDIFMHTAFIKRSGESGTASKSDVSKDSLICRYDAFLNVGYRLPEDALRMCVSNPDDLNFNLRIDGHDHQSLPGASALAFEYFDCRHTLGDIHAALQKRFGSVFKLSLGAFVKRMDAFFRRLQTTQGQFFLLSMGTWNLAAPEIIYNLVERKDFTLTKRASKPSRKEL